MSKPQIQSSSKYIAKHLYKELANPVSTNEKKIVQLINKIPTVQELDKIRREYVRLK